MNMNFASASGAALKKKVNFSFGLQSILTYFFNTLSIMREKKRKTLLCE
jgi:hypothetical protein